MQWSLIPLLCINFEKYYYQVSIIVTASLTGESSMRGSVLISQSSSIQWYTKYFKESFRYSSLGSSLLLHIIIDNTDNHKGAQMGREAVGSLLHHRVGVLPKVHALPCRGRCLARSPFQTRAAGAAKAIVIWWFWQITTLKPCMQISRAAKHLLS